ncbi:MAG: cytochrome c3 family protein [Candidatus Margulisiibacteriota bacterium]
MTKKTLALIFAVTFFFSVAARAATESSCVSCHSGSKGRLLEPVKQWNESIHKEKGVGCSDCHGGNPNEYENAMSKSFGFIGVPSRYEIPSFCAKCHADPKKMRQYNLRTDQYEQYKTSVHGKRLLLNKDNNVATCISCHSSHDIKSPGNPDSPVYRTNVPATCAKCHSDKKLMAKYNLPSNQFDEYKQSYHGKLLLEKGDIRPANCADCHGSHGATPPGVKEVANVCGNCHSLTEDYFNKSPHKRSLDTAGVPRCIDCHGNHKIRYPDISMFTGSENGICAGCHERSSKGFKTALAFSGLIGSFESEVKRTGQTLDGIKRAGVDVSLLEQKMDELNAKITEAVPVTHTLSLKSVEEKISAARADLPGIKKGIKAAGNEVSNRKKIYAGIITGLLIMVLLLYLKFKSYEQ